MNTMPAPEIDREKLRAFVRRLRKGDHLLLLGRAIDLLPKSRLHTLVRGYGRPEDLKPDAPTPNETPFVMRVKAFCDASLQGECYEDFAVNSRNCMEKSGGTDRFIVDCDRLLVLCLCVLCLFGRKR